jgi:hypothetical protein
MFIVHAHGRGARTLELPEKMIHLFKAVTGYRGYLRDLWQNLHRAYGRECGDRAAAYSHARTAFETLGLFPPDEAQPPAPAQDDEPGERKAKLKRGLRTPETAFYAPILQALDELGGTARTVDVVKRSMVDGRILRPRELRPLYAPALVARTSRDWTGRFAFPPRALRSAH